MRKIIASLDVGSSSVKLIIGEMAKVKLNVLFCDEAKSYGIKKGYIVNPERAIECLKELFKKAEDQIGFPIKKVIVNVPSYDTKCFMSSGSITITSEDKVITHNDLIKAMQLSIYNKLDDNKDLISILPTKFIINDDEVVASPINMIANKLTVNDVVVTVPKKNSDNIIKCIESMGIKVIDDVISPLADFYQFKNDEMIKSVGAIINIGQSNTTVSVFNKGILTSADVVDAGMSIIDNDICYSFKASKQDAKALREKLAICDIHLASAAENMTIVDANGDERKVSQYELSTIYISRLSEILNLAKKQINLLTKKEISYIIVSGGLCETPYFSTLLESVFGDIAYIGKVDDIGARDSKYSVALGMIKYYNSRLKLRNAEFSIFSLDEQEELGDSKKKNRINEESLLGKIFRYFFDN